MVRDRGHAVPAREQRLPGLAGAACCALALLVGPLSARAQQGSIAGRVVEEGSGRPVEAAQVFLVGTGFGALSNSDGRYLILNVPAATYTISVERIGNARASQEVSVPAGDVVVVNFQLQAEALGLDEIVVTGEAGAAKRREVGNSISQINTSQLSEPVVNTEAMLQSRATGLMLSETSAAAGSGSYIRLRGNVSVSQSNQPLIYIDGVRVYSDPLPSNTNELSGRGNSSGSSPALLNTINPQDIDRVEIIKGAAATTLYGTEAAAGVIQIFTKTGAQGAAARWTLQSTYNMQHELEFGVPGYPYMRMGPFLSNGHGMQEDLSVRGGGGNSTYFLSAVYKNQDGVLPNDHEKLYGIRGNLSFDGFQDLNIQWNTGFTRQDLENTTQTNASSGLPLNVYRGDRNYVGSEDPELLRPLLDYELTSQINHLVTGVTMRYQPTPSFTQKLTAGYDFSFVEHRNVQPFGFLTDPRGVVNNERWSSQLLTLDYSAGFTRNLTGSISNTFSVGGQITNSSIASTTAWGQTFPVPGEPTVSNGSTQQAQESRIKVVNAGFFFQDRVGLGESTFVTAGIRFDGNSAFGENLGLQAYPKLSASHILSDASFWRAGWGTMKLRAAWGQSGRAPGAFDAVKTWTPDRLGTTSAFLPQNLGNPDLGPERTTEFELGFDGAWLDNKFTAEFTYYHQNTTDALFPVAQPPSSGQWNAQLENVGTLHNSGIELNLNATLIDTETWQLELGGMVSTNHSEVVDLGGASEFALTEGPGYIVEGQPAPVIGGNIVTNPDEFAAPKYEFHYYGPNIPTTLLGQSLRLAYKSIVLTARGEYQGGWYEHSRLEEGNVQRNVKWPPCFPILEKGLENMTALERSHCVPREIQRDYFILDGSFWKLRNVTLDLPVSALVPWGDNPTLTLSARNAMRWSKMKYFDPEMAGQHGSSDDVRTIRDNVPPPATFSISLRVSF